MPQDVSTQDFWSRRRAAVEREERKAKRAEEDAVRWDAEAALEEKTDAEILAELDLPEPENLKAGDDFSAFMSQAVPDRIRRRALRVLWRANPLLANLDELLEYGEDYTDSATVVENLQTAYQVGRGMLEHVEKMARDAEAVEDAGAMPEEPVPEPVEDMPPVALSSDAPEPDLPEIQDAAGPHEDHETALAPAPRRMKFRTEEPA